MAPDLAWSTGEVVYSSAATPLPSISSSVDAGVTNALWSTPVNETNTALPPATWATGSTSFGSAVTTEPVGTLTAMPVTYATASVTGVQPATVTYASPSAMPRPVVSVGSGSFSSAATTGSGLAQAKAQRAAAGGIRGHIGGSLGGARYEGVGWSNQSPQAAIRQCCYWGTRPAAQIGVSRGRDGLWYACVLYR